MKPFGKFEATGEDPPIEFSLFHRVMLLATPCLFLVMVAVELAGKSWVFISNLYIALAAVVGLVSIVGVVHAVLIFVDARSRRVIRNIVPTLMAVGSLIGVAIALLNLAYT
jgi:hypothetical protein